jgi:hypothetical protein
VGMILGGSLHDIQINRTAGRCTGVHKPLV